MIRNGMAKPRSLALLVNNTQAHRSFLGSASSRKPDLVERSPQGMERSEFPPKDPVSGGLHRCERLP
ncbi:hypothetical protein AYI70_g8464 [Smittium culicis]|uniref:Uncharacterized protein n=1 Tax=Smittium culicis TaxID=133412 RepID=A0A1R1XFW8_9FUNG|nr:hypothetical protein AYI70_g8464 [Smittium culicis]